MKKNNKANGFSLFELVIVVAIISVMIAFTFAFFKQKNTLKEVDILGVKISEYVSAVSQRLLTDKSWANKNHDISETGTNFLKYIFDSDCLIKKDSPVILGTADKPYLPCEFNLSSTLLSSTNENKIAKVTIFKINKNNLNERKARIEIGPFFSNDDKHSSRLIAAEVINIASADLGSNYSGSLQISSSFIDEKGKIVIDLVSQQYDEIWLRTDGRNAMLNDFVFSESENRDIKNASFIDLVENDDKQTYIKSVNKNGDVDNLNILSLNYTNKSSEINIGDDSKTKKITIQAKNINLNNTKDHEKDGILNIGSSKEGVVNVKMNDMYVTNFSENLALSNLIKSKSVLLKIYNLEDLQSVDLKKTKQVVKLPNKEIQWCIKKGGNPYFDAVQIYNSAGKNVVYQDYVSKWYADDSRYYVHGTWLWIFTYKKGFATGEFTNQLSVEKQKDDTYNVIYNINLIAGNTDDLYKNQVLIYCNFE